MTLKTEARVYSVTKGCWGTVRTDLTGHNALITKECTIMVRFDDGDIRFYTPTGHANTSDRYPELYEKVMAIYESRKFQVTMD